MKTQNLLVALVFASTRVLAQSHPAEPTWDISQALASIDYHIGLDENGRPVAKPGKAEGNEPDLKLPPPKNVGVLPPGAKVGDPFHWSTLWATSTSTSTHWSSQPTPGGGDGAKTPDAVTGSNSTTPAKAADQPYVGAAGNATAPRPPGPTSAPNTTTVVPHLSGNNAFKPEEASLVFILASGLMLGALLVLL